MRKRSRMVGTVWDWSFPESDSCCVSHGVPSSLLWLTAEQTGRLRSKHQVKKSASNSTLAWHHFLQDHASVFMCFSLFTTNDITVSYLPGSH